MLAQEDKNQPLQQERAGGHAELGDIDAIMGKGKLKQVLISPPTVSQFKYYLGSSTTGRKGIRIVDHQVSSNMVALLRAF